VDLENIKKVVAKFEKRLSIEVRKQEKLNMIEEQDFIAIKDLDEYIQPM